MSHTMSEILESLGQGTDLTPEMAESAFAQLMDGELSSGQAAALLMGLRVKGETSTEIGAAAQQAISRARLIENLPSPRIESVGTGGDNSHSFNCSTTVSLYLAAMGYTVPKHGNRAVSSSCGSADAVEALGLPLPAAPEEVAAELEKHNFCFIFAPHYHPAFKHIMPIRKELGIRTLFNLLGPLLNPARPTHMLLGVARPEIMETMAEVLIMNGVERAAVVHGHGGLDELTPFGPAQVVWVSDGAMVKTELDPAEFGIESGDPADIVVKGKEEGLAAVKELLCGEGPKVRKEMVIFNLAVALHLLDQEKGMPECVARARKAVETGVAKKFAELA